MIVGVVLAGGRSTRFGREKAMAEVGGRILIERVVAVLAAGCVRVAVNARRGSGAEAFAHDHGLEVIFDREQDLDGPLAGLRAGLAWAKAKGADRLATAPCDTPFLPQRLVATLDRALDDTRGVRPQAAVAGVPITLQPLCAVWRVNAMTTIAEMLDGGAHPSVRRVLEQLDAVTVEFEAEAFFNINTIEAHALAVSYAAENRPDLDHAH